VLAVPVMSTIRPAPVAMAPAAAELTLTVVRHRAGKGTSDRRPGLRRPRARGEGQVRIAVGVVARSDVMVSSPSTPVVSMTTVVLFQKRG
jgi:hypothetical protein